MATTKTTSYNKAERIQNVAAIAKATDTIPSRKLISLTLSLYTSTDLSLSTQAHTSLSLYSFANCRWNCLMSAHRSRSGRSTPVPDPDSRLTESEKIGSWNALEWTKIEAVSRSVPHGMAEYLLEAEQVDQKLCFHPSSAFQPDSKTTLNNKQEHILDNFLDLDAFLSIAEILCFASSGVISIGYILNSQIPIWVGLGSKVSVLQFLLLVGGMMIGSVIRRRQWRRICFDSSKPWVNLVDRIEKLEEDIRSSTAVVRLMSRQLEKLWIQFRVTRKALKEPIVEAPGALPSVRVAFAEVRDG